MKNLLALAALAAAPALVSAQVSVGSPTIVNVGTVSIAPQGLEILNDTVYGSGFSNQSVFAISDPVGTPAVSLVADLSGLITWPASRGPQDIDAIGNVLYVFGDEGSAGNGIIVPIDTANANTLGTTITPAVRATGGMPISATQFYAGEADSSTPEVLDGTGASTSSGPLGPVGFRAPLRDAVELGSNVYFLSAATNGDPHTIVEFSGLAGSGDFTGASVAGFFTSTGSGSRNHVGLALYNDGTTDWLVMPQSDGTDGSIVFVDASNASNTVEVADTDLAGLQLTGIAVGDIGGVPHVAVASQNGGTNSSEVYIFEITTSADVDNWSAYN